MRFDNFPIEVKSKIMTYISREELCPKVAAVSKEWDLLAHDSLNWKDIRFKSSGCNCNHNLSRVRDTLRATRPDKVTFFLYFIQGIDELLNFDCTTFPVLPSVKELTFELCNFPNTNAVRFWVKSFPNIRRFTILMNPDYVKKPDYDDNYTWMEGLVDGMELLNQWKNLKSVKLRAIDRDFFNEIVTGIAKLDQKLEELILLHSGIITDSTLKTVIDHQGKNLRKFTMYFNGISGTTYRELKFCQNLRELTLFFPLTLTDNEFVSIVQDLNKLSFLSVQCTNTLFSNDFVQLFRDVRLPQLVELVIGDCKNFNNENLTLFVKCSPSLKRLTLRNLGKITNEGIKSLVNVGRNLKILHLESMKRVTKNCLTKISRDMPNICEIVFKTSSGRKFTIIHNKFTNKEKC